MVVLNAPVYKAKPYPIKCCIRLFHLQLNLNSINHPYAINYTKIQYAIGFTCSISHQQPSIFNNKTLNCLPLPIPFFAPKNPPTHLQIL
ncbi:hypothetical protein HanHA300_Chr02g0062401 [Helianthus annuus]|nr:hypothetical protein HanHA300_Chr02g0062401 [Helianthus annuus]KAJ0619400.1 hypothetical protein HanHA89_Chr02g0070951 [Helianthus annuus]KAJ0777850.1 hypothetical protein HanLR1_Chr02g0065181 [Helianthus annuus]